MNPLRKRVLAGIFCYVCAATAQAEDIAAVLRQFPGVWRSDGYGMLLGVNGTQVTLYEITEVSCLKVVSGSLTDLEEVFISGTANKAKDEFALTFWDYVTPVRFTREFSLPTLCMEDVASKAKDPAYNFDVLWYTYHSQYPFFDIYDTDWEKGYAEAKKTVMEANSEEAMKAAMEEVLWQMDDVHTGIETGNEVWPVVENPYKASFLREIGQRLGASYRATAKKVLVWGRLKETVGYVYVDKMGGFTEEELDEVFKEMQSAATLIVDLRFNRGGGDPAAVMLGNRVTDRAMRVWEVRAKEGEHLSQPSYITLTPGGKFRFNGKLIVLTSKKTVSAAENATMGLRSVAGAVQIGETTKGNLSSMLTRTLPNGWKVMLPNEAWRDMEGISYEGTGIPPHISVPLNSQQDFDNHRDDGLAMALQVAENPCSPVFNMENQRFFVPCLDATAPDGSPRAIRVTLDFTGADRWAVTRLEEGRMASAQTCALPMPDLQQPFWVPCIRVNQPADTTQFTALLHTEWHVSDWQYYPHLVQIMDVRRQ